MSHSPVSLCPYFCPSSSTLLPLHQGTDGLWDNVYPEEVSAIVAAARDEGWDPNRTASRLAKYARRRASDDKYISPFAYSALSMGLMYIGGKQVRQVIKR